MQEGELKCYTKKAINLASKFDKIDFVYHRKLEYFNIFINIILNISKCIKTFVFDNISIK